MFNAIQNYCIGYHCLVRILGRRYFSQNITLRCSSTSNIHSSTTKPTGSEGSIKIGNSIQPIKMAYSSYESTKPAFSSPDWPVIIMHGLLGSKNNWNSLSKVIHSKTKRKIFAVDARNHGDSPHTPELTYNHLAEDVRALMTDLNIKRAVMVGHSMGGRAMMLLALRYPELVEKLLVVDISPIGSSPSLTVMPKYFNAMRMVKLDSNIPLSVARKLADEQMTSLVSDPELRQFFLTNLVEAEGGHYKWRINLESIARNYHELVNFPTVGNVFDGPTYFIGGNNSDYIRHEEHTDIRRLFPASLFDYVPGAGHWVHSEKPSDFIRLATKFITDVKK